LLYIRGQSREDSIVSSRNEQVVVPVVHEEVDVSRERVETGVVRVRKVVQERVEVIDEPVLHDEVSIEHVAINRPVDAPQPPREEGDVLIVPVYEEVITVQKQWVLREEIHFRRREVRTRHREEVVVREESAVVERHPGRESAT
jgi:uncharacterized protein (TIGR02271 family)